MRILIIPLFNILAHLSQISWQATPQKLLVTPLRSLVQASRQINFAIRLWQHHRAYIPSISRTSAASFSRFYLLTLVLGTAAHAPAAQLKPLKLLQLICGNRISLSLYHCSSKKIKGFSPFFHPHIQLRLSGNLPRSALSNGAFLLQGLISHCPIHCAQ